MTLEKKICREIIKRTDEVTVLRTSLRDMQRHNSFIWRCKAVQNHIRLFKMPAPDRILVGFED